ncbi:hypothetical protein Prudu_006652, partial [Prunus dulcis]
YKQARSFIEQKNRKKHGAPLVKVTCIESNWTECAYSSLYGNPLIPFPSTHHRHFDPFERTSTSKLQCTTGTKDPLHRIRPYLNPCCKPGPQFLACVSRQGRAG